MTAPHAQTATDEPAGTGAGNAHAGHTTAARISGT